MAREPTDTLTKEAALFGSYLLGKPIDAPSLRLYASAMQNAPLQAGPKDRAILVFAKKHPWSLGLLDAGSALLLPKTELRRRLFILFSILETRPEYADFFLPKRHAWWQVAGVFFTGCKALGKVLVGALLVKVIVR